MRYSFALVFVFLLAAFLAAGFYRLLQNSLVVSPDSGIKPVVAASSHQESSGKHLPEAAGGYYRLARVKEAPALQLVKARGLVKPERQAIIAAKRDGLVVEVLSEPGIRVGRNVPLARLEKGKAEENLAAQKAIVRLRHKEYLEARTLLNSGKLDHEAYARYLKGYEDALTQEEIIAAELDSYVLRSPVAGTVIWQNISAGQEVHAGQELFRVGDPEPLQVVLSLLEEEVTKVSAGQQALVELPSSPGNVYEASVQGKYKKGDMDAPYYEVYVKLPPKSGLAPGMEVFANIIIDKQDNALLIPKSAVIEEPERTFVYVAQPLEEGGYGVAPAPVETSEAGLYTYRITSGLSKRDLVVTDPGPMIREKTTIVAEMDEIKLDDLQKAVARASFLPKTATSGCGGSARGSPCSAAAN